MMWDWQQQDLRWQEDAACRNSFDGVDLFFPPDNPGGPKVGKGITGEHSRVKEALKFCDRCPVKQKCLNYAMEHDCVGIWGGTTDSDRRKIANSDVHTQPEQ